VTDAAVVSPCLFLVTSAYPPPAKRCLIMAFALAAMLVVGRLIAPLTLFVKLLRMQ
jgi:hypothetical protein